MSNCFIWVCKTCRLWEKWKGKNRFLNLWQKDGVACQTSLLYPSWLGVLLLFFLLFFLSKFLLAKVVNVVLQKDWINCSDLLLQSDTNTSLFSCPHLIKVKWYFSTFFRLIYRLWYWMKTLSLVALKKDLSSL